MKTYKGQVYSLPPNGIFVFGSNTQGRHGKGAALVAKQRFEAVYGQPVGMQGRSYAICTKDLTESVHPSVSVEDITNQILHLYEYAKVYTELDFYIAYSGTGTNLNAYNPQEMADMFLAFPIPDNIIFEESFAKLLTT